jgi:uncharacterized protein YbjT (DUF2867 family)
MRVILTGATGVAGSEALRQCLADPRVENVTTLSRRPVGVADARLTDLVLRDFLDYRPVMDALSGHDACLWCLGISQTRVSPEEYEVITHDYALAGARAMAAANPRFVFCFLSGRGADSAEKSRVRFARVKGRTENALQRLDAPETYSFRPGYIQPIVPAARFEDRLGNLLAPLMRLASSQLVITAAELAQGMLHVARHGYGKRILDNAEIRDQAELALSERARGRL